MTPSASKLAKIIVGMRTSPANVKFAELEAVCVHYFGPARQSGTSHKVFATPWRGDPRVNIQSTNSGQAKAYQVRQVLKAIDRLERDEQ